MAGTFRSLDDLDVANKRVLLRGDLNVPMQDGVVSDATRLTRLIPTLDELAAKGARIILLSHFGRPKGKPDAALSLRPIVPAFEKSTGRKAGFCAELCGREAEAAVAALPPAGVLILENTRFHKGEEANDPEFVKALAKMGDVFVNDAFSAAHRAHASTEGLAHVLPACAGRDMQAELEAISAALDDPQRPLGVIVGGSKISTKLDLLKNLTGKVDVLVLGGAMANTFLAAQGHDMAASMFEADMLQTARAILAESGKKGCRILLPLDLVVAPELKENIATQVVPVHAVPAGMRAMDAGPETVKAVNAALSACKTIVWNGPMGVFEVPPFNKGTNAVGRCIAALTQSGQAMSVAGGGDTAAAVNQAGVADQLSYVSTAGGAFLEWLEGRALPGVEILRRDRMKGAA